MTVSELDAVPGLGPVRKKALLTAFGSVKRLRAADLQDIASVPGIGPSVAASVMAALGVGTDVGVGSELGRGPEQPAAMPAFDAATGELLE